MTMCKKIKLLLALLSGFIYQACAAQDPFMHTLQINTLFKQVYGKPTWELILRNTETGQVWPYLFDISKRNNSWTAFILARSYRVTVSKLQFGPFGNINNFCGLENLDLSDQSLYLTLTGKLSPVPNTFRCRLMKYRDM